MAEETPTDGTLRLDAEFLDDGDEYRISRKKILKELARAGIVIAPQPVDEHGDAERPEPVTNFDALSTRDIQNHLGQYAGWLEYVEGQLGHYYLEHEEALRRRDNYGAQIKIKKKGTAADKKAAAVADIRYRRLDLEEFKANCKMVLTEKVLAAGARELFAISRALTARGQEIERVRRENNTSGGNREAPSKEYPEGLPPSFPHKKKRKLHD